MPKTPRSRLRNGFEYAAVRVIEFALRLLPRDLAFWRGRWAAPLVALEAVGRIHVGLGES